MSKSSKIQLASTKLLNFYVNDMLSLAQINNDKFRKEICSVDIRESINEIMLIQNHKADSLSIKLHSSFLNFNSSYVVSTDE